MRPAIRPSFVNDHSCTQRHLSVTMKIVMHRYGSILSLSKHGLDLQGIVHEMSKKINAGSADVLQ